MSTNGSSTDDRLDRLEARLDELEDVVLDLRSVVRQEEKGSSSKLAGGDEKDVARPSGIDVASSRSPESERGATSSPTASSQSLWARLRAKGRSTLQVRSQDWLSYVGIGLLLFGLAFLFKYSIEQGWLVPEVRVGFGLLTGGALLVSGLRIYEERLQLRQVLLGGSIATFYGTSFAAYQLYGLLSYPIAFGSMVAVTVVAIVLSLQQDHASMAVIGTLGGLGTPFLLYTDVSGVAGLTVYTVLVLVGACAIYFYRGWRLVLYAAVSGGWLVLLFPSADAALSRVQPDGAWVLQAGIVAAWLLLGWASVCRSVLRRWPSEGSEKSGFSDADSSRGKEAVYSLVPASPFAALLASRLLWTGVDGIWAGVSIAGGLLYACAYVGLRRVSLPRYAAVHGIVAAVLFAYGFANALGGAALLLAWTVEAVLLLVLGRHIRDTPFQISGHVLFVVVGGWLSVRLGAVHWEETLFSPASLTELAVLGIGLVAARKMRHWPRCVYTVLILAGWLAWGRHVFLPLVNGQAYISLIWGGTAAALLVAGANRRSTIVQSLGLATLALFVGKLFLVDLAALPALWRIALFLGAGGSFLIVSYVLPGLGSFLEKG